MGYSHRFSQSIFIRNKALRRTKIGWQSPFFTRTHFYHGLLGALPPRCVDAVGRATASACSVSGGKTICCPCGVKRVRTTASSHTLTVYPNLVPELTLAGLNQLWVAAITYLRLGREFVYLAVVLDAYSGRCMGWSLGRPREAQLTLEALRRALPGARCRRAGAAIFTRAASTCWQWPKPQGHVTSRHSCLAALAPDGTIRRYSPHFGAYSILLAASPLTMVQG